MHFAPDRLWEVVLLLVGAWTAFLQYLWKRQDGRITDLEKQIAKTVTKADFERAVEIRAAQLERLRETLEAKIDTHAVESRQQVAEIHKKIDTHYQTISAQILALAKDRGDG
jgi:C4-dicarboxylate-specific signal transduction histidine kinase